jgi:hypothetical protein
MAEKPDYVPHQLLVHLDQHPNGDVEIHYSYPFSGDHPLPEQIIRFASGGSPGHVTTDLNEIRASLRSYIQLKPIRVPHGQVTPRLQDAILTVVTRDERRRLPIARLYCREIVPEFRSPVEREGKMEADQFPDNLRDAWTRIRQWANGVAWKDFEQKIGRA